MKGIVYLLGFTVLCLSIFALPPLGRSLAITYPEYAYLQFPVLFGVYATVIPFFFALVQTIVLLNKTKDNQVFSPPILKALAAIKYSAGIISGMYLIGMIFLFTQQALHPSLLILGVAIVLISIIIAVFTGVLQELLKKMIMIKSENDLTV
ncbi:hypothetical protein Pryu01_02641 [Paraliobacillus ryukyuensis]|uniref:DUF2975 family protein n=1 Tax=Paraliobacillus ryukyuensis TaxID=200904 RepID=A0A366DYX8_9BACI|nr:DUF2975 domain-containing protein [Paraliobacillus ryukyuensis]RBO95311.1 DUF2975 family protein [Paraliobacillus ryukyuensis]